MNITENRLNDVKPVLSLHDLLKRIYKGVDIYLGELGA